MSVEHISEGMGAPQVHKGYLDAKRKIESQKGSGKTEGTSRSDQVDISEDAKRLMNRDTLIQKMKKVLEELSDVRKEKVQQAVERINSGHYDQKEVLEKVAESFLESEKEQALSGVGETKDAASTEDVDIRWDKIQEVEKRIEQGFYNSSEVLNVVVTRLLGIE